MLKTILFYVVILVVAMLIFSAITDPDIKYKIKSKFSSVKGKLASSLDTCPQINVKMEGSNIKGKTYDGWTIKGDATCRKGNQEGENLNYYYCGGYSRDMLFGLGEVVAYVEKTVISGEGDIGKTYKYVIWNIYNENKTFVETKCLGDPDEFEKKQAEAFKREVLEWR